MLESGEVVIRFWGVRGSIARPGHDTVRYGGNTACVELRCANDLLIFDGGNADVMIYDSTYTEEEYPFHTGWGHATWQEGTRLAKVAQVKTYLAFHHAPEHDDAFMDRVAAEAHAALPGALVARERMGLRPYFQQIVEARSEQRLMTVRFKILSIAFDSLVILGIVIGVSPLLQRQLSSRVYSTFQFERFFVRPSIIAATRREGEL